MERPPLTRLIGRERELGRTLAALEEAPLVTLLGPGGAGKTRLAIAVADALAASHGRVGFTDLTGLRDPDLVLAEIASVLNVPERADVEPGVSLIEALRLVPGTLIVLDGCEGVVAAATSLHRVLAQVPQTRILATSRIALGIPGEIELAIGPLSLPEDGTVEAVSHSGAGMLFIERAREHGRLLELTANDSRDIAQLVHALDGLPLAIELAAARTRLLTPAAILRRLQGDEAAALLSQPGDAGHHRSLAAVLDWSVELLAEAERQVLFAMAAWLGPFDLPMAELLCPGLDVLGALERLVAHGLVRFEAQPDGEPRFSMLETVRNLCATRLAPGDAEALRDRHARAVLDVVLREAVRLRTPDVGGAIGRLEWRVDDIRAAFERLLEDDSAAASRLIASIWRFWPEHGRLSEAMHRLSAALERLPADSVDRGLALAALAGLVTFQRGPRAGRPLAAEAASLARRLGDARSELEALPALALAAIEDGNLRSARRYARRLIKLGSAEDDESARARGLACLGVAEGELGDFAAGVRHLDAAAAAAQRAGDLLNQGTQLANLAELEVRHGRSRQAVVHARSAIALLEDAANGGLRATALATLGNALAQLERLTEARVALRDAARIAAIVDAPDLNLSVLASAVAYLRRTGDRELLARSMAAVQLILVDPHGGRSRSRHLSDTREYRAAISEVLATRATRRTAVTSAPEDPHEVVEELLRRLESRPGLRRLHAEGTQLTPREIEVLRLLARGMSDQAIGEALAISPKTASVHVSNTKAKLGYATRLEASLAGRAFEEAGDSQLA